MASRALFLQGREGEPDRLPALSVDADAARLREQPNLGRGEAELHAARPQRAHGTRNDEITTFLTPEAFGRFVLLNEVQSQSDD